MDNDLSLRALFGPPDQPGTWLALSFGVAVIAANVVWLALRIPALRGLHARPATRPAAPALLWLILRLFALLLPFAAWRTGAVSSASLGLAGLDWASLFGANGLLALGIVIAATVGWGVYRRASVAEEPGAAEDNILPPDPARRWLAPVDAAVWQWKLAFYRAAFAGLLAAIGVGARDGASLLSAIDAGPAPFLAGPASALLDWWTARGPLADPRYFGAWLGLALLALEYVLNPYVRAALHKPNLPLAPVRAWMVCAATTGLYLLTRNFWLCLGCHVAVETIIALAPLPGLVREYQD